MRNSFFIITLLIIPLVLSAQEKNDSSVASPGEHELGVAAGFTTGYGLSYRYSPSDFGIQATFAPFKNNTLVRYSAGLTFMYRLVEGEKTHLFLYQGNHFLYRRQRPGKYYPRTNQERIRRYFNNGLGFGFQFIIVDRVEFSLMGGYGAFDDFERYNLTGEAGLFYRF